MNMLKGIFAVALLILLIACGGGSSKTPARTRTPTPAPAPTPAPTGFNVSPSSATVALRAPQVFTAASNGSPGAGNWSVSGVPGGNATVGTIDANGNFTGPASFPAGANMETVTATLQSDNTKTANASATIVFPNDNHLRQSGPVKLGTTGGNSMDFSGRFCCSGTLGSLMSRGGTLFILSNNHVLDKSDQGTVGGPVTQPGLVDTNCMAGTGEAHRSQPTPCRPACTRTCPGPP